MGRPERRDVDYFPFYIKDGRTLFILENKYQCKGTGFFTNVMRFLSRTPDHHFQIEKESDKLYFFATVKCDEVSGLDMIEIMIETQKLDRDCWEQKKVIACQDYLLSIQDAYRKRLNECITLDEIKTLYGITTGRNEVTAGVTTPDSDIGAITTDDKPQSKEKKRKEKKIQIPIPDNFIISDRVKKWAQVKGFTKLEAHLESFKLSCAAKGYEYIDWDSAFMKAITDDWAKIRQGGANGNNRKFTSEKPISRQDREQNDEAERINREYREAKARKAAGEAVRST